MYGTGIVLLVSSGRGLREAGGQKPGFGKRVETITIKRTILKIRAWNPGWSEGSTLFSF